MKLEAIYSTDSTNNELFFIAKRFNGKFREENRILNASRTEQEEQLPGMISAERAFAFRLPGATSRRLTTGRVARNLWATRGTGN
jgi:hypothetical protein